MFLDKSDNQILNSKRNWALGALALVGTVAACIALSSSTPTVVNAVEPAPGTLVLAASAECPAFTDLEWKKTKIGLKFFDTNRDGVFNYTELSPLFKDQDEATKKLIFKVFDSNSDNVVDLAELCYAFTTFRNSSGPTSLLKYSS